MGCTLPPLVDGPAHGSIEISFARPQWLAGHPDRPLIAFVHWWGAQGNGDTLLLPHGSAHPARLLHELRTSAKYVARYLSDCGSLVVSLEFQPAVADGKPQVLGTVTIGLMGLAAAAAASSSSGSCSGALPSLSGRYPIVSSASGSNGNIDGAKHIIGSLEVGIQLNLKGIKETAPSATDSITEPSTAQALLVGVGVDKQEQQKGGETDLGLPPALFAKLQEALAE